MRLVLFFAAVFVQLAYGTSYECKVNKKIASSKNYSESDLKKWKFSVRLDESEASAKVSRCSFSPSASQITCDEYVADKVEADANIGAKKFYVFNSQYDFQLFKDLSGVENNGRGDIAFVKCEKR